jgi:AraC-like DNA-binding protein
MPTVLVCSDSGDTIKELIPMLTSVPGWTVTINEPLKLQLTQIDTFSADYDLHFLIYAKNLETKTIQELHTIRKAYPFLFIIYYNSCLFNQQFLKLYELGINSCFVGNQRKNYLKENLPRFWQKHWKRIPEKIYLRESALLAPRAKKILAFIENKSLEHFHIYTLARHLKISQSHLRAEFKKYFGINFRVFRQKLLRHYESVLLLDNNYQPNTIYKLLNYSNLANLSRSFKVLHGECWRNLNHQNSLSYH